MNEVEGFKRWNKMTLEHPSEKNYGTQLQWGEWQQEKAGEPIRGERWMEMLKEHEDYWERKSEKYDEMQVRKPLENVDQAFSHVLDQPNLIRSGLSEYKNNRNYHYAEKWDEFQDGTQIKRVVLDDGFGKRTLKEL